MRVRYSTHGNTDQGVQKAESLDAPRICDEAWRVYCDHLAMGARSYHPKRVSAGALAATRLQGVKFSCLMHIHLHRFKQNSSDYSTTLTTDAQIPKTVIIKITVDVEYATASNSYTSINYGNAIKRTCSNIPPLIALITMDITH